MTTQDILSRLDLLESRIAIERLITEYAQAFDNRDKSLLRSVWHDDAYLSLGEPFGDYHGVEAIMEASHNNWQSMPHMHHWMANVIVNMDGDTATAVSANDCLCTNIEMGPVQISGTYNDRFERRAGRWAFIERRFELHYLTPLFNWKPVLGTEMATAES